MKTSLTNSSEYSPVLLFSANDEIRVIVFPELKKTDYFLK
jgi:hypothetical protein